MQSFTTKKFDTTTYETNPRRYGKSENSFIRQTMEAFNFLSKAKTIAHFCPDISAVGTGNTKISKEMSSVHPGENKKCR